MQTKPKDIRARDGTLVIVDMQPAYTFDCKNPHLLSSVLKEIDAAIKSGWSIVALEIAPWKKGATDDAIIDRLKEYKRLPRAFVRVVKAACSTNFDEPGAWAAFRRRSRMVVA